MVVENLKVNFPNRYLSYVKVEPGLSGSAEDLSPQTVDAGDARTVTTADDNHDIDMDLIWPGKYANTFRSGNWSTGDLRPQTVTTAGDNHDIVMDLICSSKYPNTCNSGNLSTEDLRPHTVRGRQDTCIVTAFYVTYKWCSVLVGSVIA
ncbi:hypothetical protein J6590_004731 [Homalodisca vitripennis]|nr:hypothetical protein J6590_004731 [Homalodisca vitripennis]